MVIDLIINLINVGTVDSTNDYLKKLVSKGAGHKTAVIAEAQTNGRGRQGKSFVSPPGGIYMSVYYDFKDMREENLPLVTPTVAVCVARAIEEAADADVRIKWVNDIYYKDRKICGILTEKTGTQNGFIVGVGINLSDKGIPEELRDKAGFIKADKSLLVRLLAEKLDFSPESLENKDFLSFYRAKSYLFGKTVRFERNGKIMTGKALNVDERYRLEVMTDGGVTKLDCGEVSVAAI